jgi:hypothetical protein
MPGLIAHPGAIWLAVEPVDMRRGMDGLSMVVQQVLGHTPCAGSAFVFHNRTGNRLKALVWDGTGVWLCQRRLAAFVGTSTGALAGLNRLDYFLILVNNYNQLKYNMSHESTGSTRPAEPRSYR